MKYFKVKSKVNKGHSAKNIKLPTIHQKIPTYFETTAAKILSKLHKSPSRNPPAHIYTLIARKSKFPNNARENKN